MHQTSNTRKLNPAGISVNGCQQTKYYQDFGGRLPAQTKSYRDFGEWPTSNHNWGSRGTSNTSKPNSAGTSVNERQQTKPYTRILVNGHQQTNKSYQDFSVRISSNRCFHAAHQS
jgi:hypothetical protein